MSLLTATFILLVLGCIIIIIITSNNELQPSTAFLDHLPWITTYLDILKLKNVFSKITGTTVIK